MIVAHRYKKFGVVKNDMNIVFAYVGAPIFPMEEEMRWYPDAKSRYLNILAALILP